MRTDKPNSRVRAKLLYRTSENQPYDVAVLRVDPQHVDSSLKPVRLSDAPILKGKYFMLSISFYVVERNQKRHVAVIPATSNCCHSERHIEASSYPRSFLGIRGNWRCIQQRIKRFPGALTSRTLTFFHRARNRI